MKKLAYIFLGLLFLALGLVGTVIPLLPTTPFVLLAAICFGKGSDKLRNWFTSTRIYKNTIVHLGTKKALPKRAKLILLTTISAAMGLSFFVMLLFNAPPAALILLVTVWIVHIVYFIQR